MDAAEPFTDVHRIVVLRAGGLGDLLFTVPALHALHESYPQASIEILGAPVAALLEGRLPFPVTTRRLPPVAGVTAPPDRPTDVSDFVATITQQPIDLAVQLHGGGRFSNPFLLSLGARHTVGCATDDADALERTLPYRFYQHEVARDLEVVGLAGALTMMREPRLAPLDEDLARADQALGITAEGHSPLVVLHPGATDPRRRWPVGNFAQLASALAREGAQVAVIGDRSEQELAEAVVREAEARGGSAGRSPVVSLAGRLGLGGLTGLLARADLVVANDSGPRHLADALGTATCSVYWCGNVITAGPQTRLRHRIRIAWVTSCPVCGVDVTQVGWTAQRCPHDPSFVASVGVDAVLEDARSLLGSGVAH
ncbi:glycosyltransferase family 9 protein [Propionibacterium cyclohexanicum]|nr:glycosyltransferase family 9 protein [Propionibacterium cyclohexanicum]